MKVSAIKTAYRELYLKAVEEMAELSVHLYRAGNTDTRPSGAGALARLFDVDDDEFLADVEAAKTAIFNRQADEWKANHPE